MVSNADAFPKSVPWGVDGGGVPMVHVDYKKW